MRRAAARHHQPHRVAFKAKCRLHADKDVAERQSLNEQIAAKRVYRSRRRAPVAFNLPDVRTQAAIFLNTHSISDVSCGAERFGVASLAIDL